MFGYVMINKPELKIKDFECYQAFYCGLCQSLKKEQGRFGQIALNYDMTFLTVLLTGLYEPESKIKDYRCLIHPTAKRKIIQNEYSSYAADMTIVLAYFKSIDDWQDEKKYTKLGYRWLLNPKMKKIEEKYPGKIEKIGSILKEINRLELEDCKDIDILSSLFGDVMVEILQYKDDIWQNELGDIGKYLGKFIYLLDAYEDVEEDIEKNQFNPLKERFKEEGFDDWMKEILEMMMAKCAESFEVLPIIEYVDVLRNILYSGVWMKFEQVKHKRMEKIDGSI